MNLGSYFGPLWISSWNASEHVHVGDARPILPLLFVQHSPHTVHIVDMPRAHLTYRVPMHFIRFTNIALEFSSHRMVLFAGVPYLINVNVVVSAFVDTEFRRGGEMNFARDVIVRGRALDIIIGEINDEIALLGLRKIDDEISVREHWDNNVSELSQNSGIVWYCRLLLLINKCCYRVAGDRSKAMCIVNYCEMVPKI